MTNLDRDSLRKQLLAVAERIEAAPAETSESADRYAKNVAGGSPHAYQVGALGQVCRNEAGAIRVFVATYLTPKTPRRSRRGRR